jgi:hypothetical protein
MFPVTVAEQSKFCTAFYCLNTAIIVSNSTGAMDVLYNQLMITPGQRHAVAVDTDTCLVMIVGRK